jgi:hypothetical protein
MTEAIADPEAVFCLPVAVVWADDVPMVEYRWFPQKHLSRWFIEPAVARAKVARIMPLDSLPLPSGPLSLRGYIHHIWRCGSSLLCRQLETFPRTVALGEPYFLADLLSKPGQSPSLVAERIRKLIGAVCTALEPIADRVIIKWPSHLSQHAAEIAAALPEVPGLFLHRAPVEVLASMERNPLGLFDKLPDSYRGRLAVGRGATNSFAAVASVIAANCDAAAAVKTLRHVDYARLPMATVTDIAPYFGFTVDAAAATAMIAAAVPHSKDNSRQRTFSSDSQSKRDEASAEAHMLAAEVIAPALNRLIATLPPIA